MNIINDPAFIDWLTQVAIAAGVSILIAGALSALIGRLAGVALEYRVWGFIVAAALLCSLAIGTTGQHGTWLGALHFAMIPPLIVFIYFLPTVIVLGLRHPKFQSTFMMNLLFGWTIIGWFMALFSALRRPPAKEGTHFRITPFGAVPFDKR
jgi:hypothetical protein